MPGPYDPNDAYENNAMQRNAGLTQPFMPQPPQFMTPGQFSSGLAASFRAPQMQGGMFPNAFATPIPTFTNSSPFLQGPGGVLMPMNPAAMSNPAGGVGNPYAQAGSRFSNGSIYQPSMQGPPPAFYGPTGNVNPFSTIPGAQFDTPFQWNASQNMATAETSAGFNSFGHSIGARFAGNAVGGAAGAYAGFKAGGFGGMLAGGAVGMVGAEVMGAGRFAQNTFMRNFGMRDLNEASYASGISQLSRQFISGGADGDNGGQGFSYMASRRAARGLDDMANSSGFRRETLNKFNTADVMKITQEGTNNGLMNGVGSPEQMRDRVRSLAKTLSSFMELAQDPDLRSAMQTMGNMQLQGLNQPQMLNAVRNGRAFARMAGTTFQQMAEVGGGIGAQTYQSVGLTQGLGFQSGMMNAGLAQSSINRGVIGSQLGNLVGGAQGLGAMNTMASAGFLQSPVLAPAMMSHAGGLNTGALQSLLSGGGNPMRMASMGAGNMYGIAGRMGPEGLAMALSMQPLLQDSIGRAMQSSGPFTQRNVEDRSMMSLMRQMGSHGSAGFMQSARLMGHSESQAVARAMEMSSPAHYQRQVEGIETQRLERNAETQRSRRANQPTWFDEVSGASRGISSLRTTLRDAGNDIVDGWDQAFAGPQRYRNTAGSDQHARNNEDYWRSSAFQAVRSGAETRARGRPEHAMGAAERFRYDIEGKHADGLRGFEAWGQALVGSRTPEERRAQAEATSQRAGIAQTLLNTRSLSAADMTTNTNRFFGGDAGARSDVAQAMARAMGNSRPGMDAVANTITRGGAGLLSMGNLDPGNVRGARAFDPNSIRDAYVDRMVRGGRSRDVAMNDWRQHGTEIQQTTAAEFRTVALPEELRNAQEAGALGGRGTRDRSLRDVGREMADEGFRTIYGGQLEGADTVRGGKQRSLIRNMDAQWEDVGSTPEERLRNRGMMTTMANLRAVTQNEGLDVNERRRASQRLTEMTQSAERRGVNMTLVHGQLQRYRGTGDQRDMQERLGRSLLTKTGAQLDRESGDARIQITGGEGVERQAEGYERLANQGGVLAEIYRTDGHAATQAEVEQRLRNVGADPGRLAALRRQNRSQAEIAATGARGGNITNATQGAGRDLAEAAMQAHTAFQHREGSHNAIMKGVRGVGRWAGLLETEDEYVDKTVNAGTAADADAAGQTGVVSAAREAARALGIGGSGDQMVEAARDLKRAAELFTAVVESGSLDSLTNNINGGT
jgi:hypothetical protein